MNKHMILLAALFPFAALSMQNANVPNVQVDFDQDSQASTINDSDDESDNESAASTVPGDGDQVDNETMEIVEEHAANGQATKG